ncbi:ribonuclease H-like domain-containing protein, partial [Tanacetum coccineum]
AHPEKVYLLKKALYGLKQAPRAWYDELSNFLKSKGFTIVSTSQTPTQQTPHTVSTIKLPILKKGEYDIWAMKMEHYLAHTDNPISEVIQNGNGPVLITTDTQGQIKVLPPRTTEEILARERERKARTTLLMALLEDH